MTPSEASPRIWRVLGDKKGDNSQVDVIAEALEQTRGWTSELRHLEMLPEYVKGKPRVAPTLHHIDRARSDPLEPPWPDLILTRGRRPSNVALWIKRQSGGRTRIVLLGKPAGWLSHYMSQFDLVITSSETLPPPFDNVMQIDLPLMQIGADRLEAGRVEWQDTLAPLPRPLVAFLIGGPTSPYVYNSEAETRLRKRIAQVLARGGTPYLVGSRRTPSGFLDRLQDGFPDTLRVFDWARPEGENPYTGLLALGDRFVVTGDSISMQVEVARLGKPLEILPLPFGWLGRLDDARRRLAAWMFQPARAGHPAEAARLAMARGLYHLRLMQQTRHFPRFHQILIDRGLASWAGDAEADTPTDQPIPTASADDVTRILARIDPLLRGV
ncbi:fission protein ELM1 [Roseovarius tolerans]|uniref:Fission protein ELM1 n=1 Tax=Roseovarius tolerans TaxID=74031 RepID=A0A1H8CHB5_9RHOB|nr:ELM1/GtrOC1 family putative glycosyltransferase [Roseovarius tolerans]SEM94386.1 fission protein ELM1 [Roseovarius tolerans]